MNTTRAEHRRRAIRRTRRRRTLSAVIAVALVGAGVAAIALTRAPEAPLVADDTAASATPLVTPTPTPTPTPLTPAQSLLAGSTDPNACAVSFAGDGIALDPQLEPQGARYQNLPIPHADGRVFAGWYDTATAASAMTQTARLNGADLVACTDRRRTLHAGWTTPEANAAEAAGIPILMYHQFTRNPNGEDNWLRLNYTYIGDFDAQMAHIQQSDFYLPTWDEMSAFIDGRLFLPKHSVVITDDDADSTWLEMAAPIVGDRKLLTTSFVITSARTEGTPNPFVLQRSHTHDMHRAGANGKGRMVNDDADTIAADLERSAQILGAKEVVAYPFGHYNDTTKEGLRRAGFELGRTIEHGYVRIGTDKLALPVIRMNYGMTVDDLKKEIG
ncbi:polysaccharide deacetylase family protein [uncultured Microbacterium sp.]|uniref:polysaccharide deacetylase family protein n=1 Tax=uncultured Microbacterium sp. TaxID=191216 RepID=UPI003749076D